MSSLSDSQSGSDIGALWAKALENYQRHTEINLRQRKEIFWNLPEILRQQEHDLMAFQGRRHDGGKIDSFRSWITANSEILQTIVNVAVEATEAVCPPVNAIVVAMNIVVGASKKVTADYDMVESFFGIMHTFLLRLTLLEGALPGEIQYQTALINVFEQLLILSGVAHRYCKEKNGRLRKWATKLVAGDDEELQTAYTSLNDNLKQLESMNIVMTLRKVLDTKITIDSNTKFISDGFSKLEKKHDQDTVRVLEHLTSLQTVAASRDDQEHTMTMIRTGFARVDERLERLSEQEPRATMKGKNLASKNSHALQFLVDQIGGPATGKLKAKRLDLERSYVKGTCLWVERDSRFINFKGENIRFLWIVGEAGMGKSVICDHLQRSLSLPSQHEPGVSVTSFIFDASFEDLRDCISMMSFCALEIAGKDPEYRQALMSERDIITSRGRYGNVDVETYWEKLFTSKFSSNMSTLQDKKLIVILDGVDQMAQEEQENLFKCLSRTVNNDCTIRFILTSQKKPETIHEGIRANMAWLDIKLEDIATDLLKVAKAKVSDSSLTRLSKLRKKFRNRVAHELSNRADNFFYLEHMSRQFNGLGREHLITEKLENLPINTQTVYETLLDDCTKNMSTTTLSLLRDLLTWVAYSRDTLTLGASKSLLNIISQKHGISVEEELDGRLSRLLRTSTSGSIDEDNAEESSNEDSNAEINTTLEGQDKEYHEEMSSLLFFQESSLRAFFRQDLPQGTTKGLRVDKSSAHVTMFKIISSILTDSKSSNGAEAGLDQLFQYASQNWLQHFLDIPLGQLKNEQTAIVIESLYRILTNNGNGLQRIEKVIDGDPFAPTNLEHYSIFGSSRGLRKRTLDRITLWTGEATKLPDALITPDLKSWTRSLRENSVRSFVLVARSHVMNWFAADSLDDATRSFRFAHQALLFAQREDLVELTQNPDLDQYLKSHTEIELTRESVTAVSKAFWDIPKTPLTQRRIALVLQGLEMGNEALDYCQEALKSAMMPQEIFELCHTVTEAKYAVLYERSQNPDEKDKNKAQPGFTLPSGEEKEKLQEVMDFAERSLHHRPVVRETSAAAKALISDMLLIKAHLHIRFGRYEYAKNAAVEALKSPITRPRFIIDIMDWLAAAERWDDIMSILQGFSTSDVWACICLTLRGADYHTSTMVQKAARMTENGPEALLKLYNGFPEQLDGVEKYWIGQSRLRAAEFCSDALGDLDKAKNYLGDALRPESDRQTKDEASMMLSDILLQQFRIGASSRVKSPMVVELKKQTQGMKEIQGGEFEPDLSQTMVPWAHMLKQWGPTTEFQETLQSTFEGCISTLQDNNPDNDQSSFRMLARVLMMIPGLETDAAIASTLQFYAVDSETSSNASHEVGTNQDIAVLPTEKANDRKKWKTWYWCNYCRNLISDWEVRGAAYMCFYCSEMDICHDCYTGERQEQIDHGTGWRVLCPRGHQHVESPVDGWDGIQNGIFRIKGQDFVFKEWLEDLRSLRWPDAWKKFWLAGNEESLPNVMT